MDGMHSMIMEMSGDLNLSSIIPNWKNTSLEDIETRIKAKAVSIAKMNEDVKNRTIYQDPGSAKYISPRWRKSKFGKMTPTEVMDYAYESEEHRKEVRDFVEKEWEWYKQNAPDGIFKRRSLRQYERDIERGLDPADAFYRGAETRRSPEYIFFLMIPLILQLLIWLL